MKTSSFTKYQLLDKLNYEGYREISKNYFQRYVGRVEYSYTLKEKSYIYLELEESLKEGWYTEEFKYKL